MNPVRWAWNQLVVADLILNTTLLCSSTPETLSKRAARARAANQRWGCVLCAWLDRINAGHCDRAPFGP